MVHQELSPQKIVAVIVIHAKREQGLAPRRLASASINAYGSTPWSKKAFRLANRCFSDANHWACSAGVDNVPRMVPTFVG